MRAVRAGGGQEEGRGGKGVKGKKGGGGGRDLLDLSVLALRERREAQLHLVRMDAPAPTVRSLRKAQRSAGRCAALEARFVYLFVCLLVPRRGFVFGARLLTRPYSSVSSAISITCSVTTAACAVTSGCHKWWTAG